MNIILVPYRNRKAHLDTFIKDVVPLFEQHLTPFKVIVVEQEEGKLFNRGQMLNIGYDIYKDSGVYFFTHDVDNFPKENVVSTLYKKEIDANTILGIRTPACGTLGCIVKFHKDVYAKINGFPNDFWGWGVEDKNFQNRAETYNIKIEKNFLKGDKNTAEFFTVLDDIDDRKHSGRFHSDTSFEYNKFKSISHDDKVKHALKTGLNNLKYTILEEEDLTPNGNVRRVKVSI